jgi:hypothetical protein
VGKTKFRLEKPKVSGQNPEVSFQNPEVSGKIFELEISVKVVFRNALVAVTRNFELLRIKTSKISTLIIIFLESTGNEPKLWVFVPKLREF